ncbi:tyrosine-type recombinase/integrase [Clostridium beijerinckii]|uniref:Integrase/recombinase XerD n=1 Tax=Clostridium beijerinckii TaxID=1520 RepID=A0AAE5H0I9_CLOBE|nr:tyrosine-type recombinase/integrase [Clostridium beijerinckii]NSB12087.1 integrase/recombinase XerD [Clostridium beijerinckii]OOM27421.1 tyrosine recombinase XerD [Clostridium beijerinckii]
MKISMDSNSNNPRITFDEGYDQFIKYCKVRNLRPATIKHYDNTMLSIYKFINPKTLVKDITKSTVDGFILYCRNELNVKDVTINTYVRTLRSILYYFMKLGWMKEFKVPNVRFDKHIIETYSEEELKLLLERPNKNKCTFTIFRSWTIVNFLIGTGVRVNSLVNIKNKDIDFENEVVLLDVTKNRQSVIIPLSSTLISVLREYMSIRGGELEDYLFCTEFGKKADRQTINTTINSYNKKRGVMKTGLHRFRHTFAKLWILNGGDVFKLQKMLCHSDMRIVRNYVEMFTCDIKKDFNNYNPLEGLQDNKNYNSKIKLKRK